MQLRPNKYGNKKTSLLLRLGNENYEDVVYGGLIDMYDIFEESIKNLSGMVEIKEKIISKQMALDYYNSINKTNKDELEM